MLSLGVGMKHVDVLSLQVKIDDSPTSFLKAAMMVPAAAAAVSPTHCQRCNHSTQFI